MASRCRSLFKAELVVVGESAGATIAALSWNLLAEAYVLLWPAFDLLDTDFRPHMDMENSPRMWSHQCEHDVLAGFSHREYCWRHAQSGQVASKR